MTVPLEFGCHIFLQTFIFFSKFRPMKYPCLSNLVAIFVCKLSHSFPNLDPYIWSKFHVLAKHAWSTYMMSHPGIGLEIVTRTNWTSCFYFQTAVSDADNNSRPISLIRILLWTMFSLGHKFVFRQKFREPPYCYG